MEKYHITVSQIGFDSCVVIAADYHTAPGLVALDKKILYPAIHQVVQAHGALAAQIYIPKDRPGAVPQFVRLPTIDLDPIVEFVEDDGTPVDETLRAELGRVFDLGISCPLWHLTVIGGRTVVFAYHHVIADGQSGPAFHSSLLSALNNPHLPSYDGGSEITISNTSTIAGPIEALTDVSMSWSLIWHTVYKMIASSSWTEGPYSWTGKPTPPSPSLEMSVRCWEISSSQTAEILRLCREKQTTFTAFLYTLVTGVLSKLVMDSQGGKPEPYKTISVVVAVSLRRFTGASPFALCDHVCSAQSYVPMYTIERDTNNAVYFPWAVTADFATRIQAAVKKSREMVGLVRLLFWLGMEKSYFRGMLGKKRETGLTISNLGKFPIRDAERGANDAVWRLGSVYFAQCDVVRGAAIKMNVLGSPAGTTNITFTWGKDSIEADFAERLISEVKTVLSAMFES